MYIENIKFIAALILLVVVTAVVASAQRKSIGDFDGFAPAGYYTGVQTAQGTSEGASGMQYGNTFVLNSYGEWETNHLSVSVDYSVNQLIANNFVITGGSWSLAIYRDNAYVGTLYGTVSNGGLLLTTNSAGDPSKETQINLISTGGLGAFTGKENEGIIGVYQAVTNLRTGETAGSAVFRF